MDVFACLVTGLTVTLKTEMHYLSAVQLFTKKELRALAKARGLRWYSYLIKRELAFRLFGLDASINRGLCQLNQLRRYQVPIPAQAEQWSQLPNQ